MDGLCRFVRFRAGRWVSHDAGGGDGGEAERELAERVERVAREAGGGGGGGGGGEEEEARLLAAKAELRREVGPRSGRVEGRSKAGRSLVKR
jgi:hypothetical protein